MKYMLALQHPSSHNYLRVRDCLFLLVICLVASFICKHNCWYRATFELLLNF